MKLSRPGLAWYVDRINENKSFTFVRYGDGEWSAILNDGRKMTGTGSHRLDLPGMRKQLSQSLMEKSKSKRYIVALRQTALKPNITTWLYQRGLLKGWHDCTVFYKASRRGQLFPLIEAIRKSELSLVVVGPPHLAKLKTRAKLPVERFIPVPKRNCYKVIGKTIDAILDQRGKPLFVSISAGPPGKLIAWRLFKHIGQNSIIIDFGSLWDIYCGVASRHYQRKMKAETIAKNLGGDNG